MSVHLRETQQFDSAALVQRETARERDRERERESVTYNCVALKWSEPKEYTDSWYAPMPKKAIHIIPGPIEGRQTAPASRMDTEYSESWNITVRPNRPMNTRHHV